MRNSIIIFVVILLFSANGFGQDTTSIPSENVEVIKNYEASIAQAQKKSIQVKNRDNKYNPIVFNYSQSTPKAIDFDRPDPVIRAMAYKPKDRGTADIKDGTIYGAYGNYNTIKAGAAYHYYIEDWIEAGINLNHFCASDNNQEEQKYRHTFGELYAGYYFNPNTKLRASFFGDIDRNYTVINYQYYDPEFTTQAYNQGGIKLDFSHVAFEKLGLSLRSSIAYDKLKQTEAQLDEKTFKAVVNVYKRISDNVSIELPFAYSNTKNAYPIDTIGLKFNELRFAPSLDIKNEKYLLSAGIQYVKGEKRNMLFPDIRLKLTGIVADFDLGLEVYPEIQRLSLSFARSENPFVSIGNSRTLFDTYKMVQNYKFVAGKKLGVHQMELGINYRRIDKDIQYAFRIGGNNYAIDTTERNELVVNFDYSLKLGNEFSVHADVKHFVFLNDSRPSYLPKWTGSLNVNKSFNKKLDIGLTMLFLSDRIFSRGLGLEDFVISNNFDLALKLKYRINKSINVFFESSNLLASKDYAIWYWHPVLERQFWGGLQFNF